ncbi:MAG: hypothetical protein WC479_11530 [Candidatus Izemoplasmatales bacterium]|jgi:hypothetical protein
MENRQTSGSKLTHEEINRLVLNALNGKVDVKDKASLLNATKNQLR